MLLFYPNIGLKFIVKYKRLPLAVYAMNLLLSSTLSSNLTMNNYCSKVVVQ